MMRFGFALLGLVACGGGTPVEQTSDLLGHWQIETGQPDASARSVTFEEAGPAFSMTTSGDNFANGTFNVQIEEGLVLLFPVDPANTTWCSPSASINRDGEEVCFDAFDAARCALAVGRVPVESPLVGCYLLQ
ncbi:MAG: hypothetical protein ABI867_07525 [Kofleriaceae bacterium]